MAPSFVVCGTTYLAIYNQRKTLLDIRDVTSFDQSALNLLFENMKDAKWVKLFKWNLFDLLPLHDDVELSVTVTP